MCSHQFGQPCLNLLQAGNCIPPKMNCQARNYPISVLCLKLNFVLSTTVLISLWVSQSLQKVPFESVFMLIFDFRNLVFTNVELRSNEVCSNYGLMIWILWPLRLPQFFKFRISSYFRWIPENSYREPSAKTKIRPLSNSVRTECLSTPEFNPYAFTNYANMNCNLREILVTGMKRKVGPGCPNNVVPPNRWSGAKQTAWASK